MYVFLSTVENREEGNKSSLPVSDRDYEIDQNLSRNIETGFKCLYSFPSIIRLQKKLSKSLLAHCKWKMR